MFGAPGRCARQVATIFNDGIQHLAIVRGDVLHIAHVLVTPFNLEGAHACVDKRTEVGGLIVVLHGKQVFFERHDAALIVFQGIRQTTGLRAIAAVSTAACLRMGDVALSGIGHTQRTVDKELNGRVGRLVYIADLVQVQLTRQHNLRKTHVGKKLRLFHGTDIALGTGMQFNWRDIQLQYAHVLYDQGINTGLVEIGDQTLRRLQFIIMKNGVQGDEHFRPKAVGERHKPGYVAQAVTGVMAGTEAWATDIDGISTVKDRFTGYVGVAGRTQKFKMMGVQAHTSSLSVMVKMAAIVFRSLRQRNSFACLQRG